MFAFTIIIPCYNVSEYLPYCMQCLEQQSIGIRNLQIILIDDASTDDWATVDLLLRFEQKYPDNVLVIRSEENLRQGGARNLGLEYAEGTYLAFCDSDDYMHPDMLKICYDYMEAYELDLLEFDKNYTEKHILEFTHLTTHPDQIAVQEITDVKDRKKFLRMEDSILTCWASVYRTSIIQEQHIRYIEKVFFEEPSFTYPYRFYVRRYGHIQDKLYYYYRHPGSTTSSRFATKRMDTVVNYTYVTYDLKKRGLFPDYIDEIAFQVWESIFYHNMIYAAQTGVLFQQEELQMMQQLIVQNFPDIRHNPYFIQYYQPVLFLGDLTYCNFSQVSPAEVLSLYQSIWDTIK